MADPSMPVPERLQGYVPTVVPPSPVEDVFKQADRDFSEQCRCAIQRNIVDFKIACQAVHAIGRAYHPFPQHLRFILSGGGSRLGFYFDLLGADFEERLIPVTPWHPDRASRRNAGEGLRRISFDMPQCFHEQGISDQDFDRLSVAHGLAYGGDNLMAITSSHGI